MKKRIEDFIVSGNNRLNKEFFVLTVQSSVSIEEILPGQFAQVKVDDSPHTFLRRPLSIYDVNYIDNTLQFLIKIAGTGTTKLSTLASGTRLNLIYPLGNSFSLPSNPHVLLVGGGTGVAPMLLLGKYLREKMKIIPHFLMGYRSKELIAEIERFETIGNVNITTEDGSAGHKGFVTEHPLLGKQIPEFGMIYSCGPEAMMKAVACHAKAHRIPCEVSLENLMGCGFGACLCCIVNTSDKGNVNSCTEGPVFNSERLRW
jgi:dihydroorotate dehydrogenase electron transfer subunit